MTTLLSKLDRFEQAAVTYETSTAKADRDELHAARRAIMEAFEARALHGPYGWLIMPEGLSEEHWQLANEPDPGTPSEPLFAQRQLVLGDASPPAPAVGEREAELVKALEPFAAVAEHDIGETETDQDWFRPMTQHNRAPRLTVGHLRAARAAIHPSIEQE